MVAANFQTAATKSEVVLTSGPDAILTPFQRQWWGFRGPQLNRSAANDVSVANNVHFQHGYRQTGSCCNFDLASDIDVVLTATMGFTDPSTQQKCYQ
jgi:hypothetical protein